MTHEANFGNMWSELWYGAPAVFKLVFGIIICFFLFIIFKIVKQAVVNHASPVITAFAKVVDKRTNVWGGSGDSSASTSYYITFELEDGSRLELQVRSDRYGLIVVGDTGEVTYQGTGFKEFVRIQEGRGL